MDSEEDQQSSPSSSWSDSDRYLLGFVIANIVGLKHHSATISGRQMVGLVREPLNPDDPNAIQVLNTRALPVGYIERSVAAVLSPLIDTNLITVEAIVPASRSQRTFRVSSQLHIFSQPYHFNAVKDSLHRGNLHLITESDPAFTFSDSVAVKETKTKKKCKSIDAIFKLVDENMSSDNSVVQVLEPPKTIIKSELFQHQKEALAWLVRRENSGELPPFWEENDGHFVNILTNFLTDVRPEPLRGGILADDMGLGKTLTLLSLIAFDKERRGKTRVVTSPKTSSRTLSDSDSDTKTNATLVVCPPSVMSTWITQLEEHTFEGALKTYMYYGERTRNTEELKMYDLVLTTYSTLASEHVFPELPAKRMEWRRVVLDEAHTIKNFGAQQTAAVVDLKAQYRWAVTGTPIQSGCIDLFSLMVFLRFEPFSVRNCWQTFVQRPLNQGRDCGLSRLQILMGAIALRRTKEEGLVGLPPKTVETLYVELSFEERQLYDLVKERTKTLLMGFVQNDSLVPHYSSVLSMILRLRQICTDLNLCPSDLKSLLPSYNIEDVSNNPELLQTLLGLLQDGEDLDCPICISPPTDIVITCCAHIFCRDCILKVLQTKNHRCPLCRCPLKDSDLFSTTPESTSKTDSSELCPSGAILSSKVSILIKLLTESRDQHPAKSVVFSQFRKMLLLLEKPLNAAGFKTLHLDGTMNAKHRARVIEQFQAQGRDGPMVLLASLRASSAGINLTAASRVYFMEPWWNHAVEEQAMDRVHRIGQKEAVKVIRLIAKNSIEEKILMLQEKKKQLAREPFGRGLKDAPGMPMQDLRFLLDD
ncbi:hypothetical protein VNO77_16970 [Canavalia gladiata]|uniref:SWI/SNF-related matrix-associated actin-dependent regulator of chromatin subfamily A member 3-like 1 n=1 Tax=Canavalia gladiata TaxID=3824 RepID=A0AAN9LLP7_CANGL